MYIKVKVRPNSKKDQIIEIEHDLFEVHLRAKPERNEANRRLLELLNNHFENPVGGVKIINGHHSRVKLLKIGNE